MKTTKSLLAAVALSVGLLSASGANAALTSTLGGQGVYDTDLNLTWLANANLAASNTFGVSGINSAGYMTWDTSQSWIAAMNTANYLGFNDWRLPTTVPTDTSCVGYGTGSGLGCTGSEMGHLFYTELGGVGWWSILSRHNANLALFQNVQSYGYWSDTEVPPVNQHAWVFDMGNGYQSTTLKNTNYNQMFAWAVRDGQVISAVPEPETYAMLLAGLGLLGFAARRRKDLDA